MGCVEGVLPLGADPGCGAAVHRSRGVQPDPGVTVLMGCRSRRTPRRKCGHRAETRTRRGRRLMIMKLSWAGVVRAGEGL